jgi:hypothetical protein
MADNTEEGAAAPAEMPVWGARAIGRVIGRKPTETFHLLKAGKLPAKKIGASWVAMPSALLRACGADLAD